MGRTYLFECPRCAYRARVSGGRDEGVDRTVVSVVCTDCRRVFDAVIQLRTAGPEPIPPAEPSETPDKAKSPPPKPLPPPAFEAIVDLLPLRLGNGFHWREFPLQCPVSAAHSVQPWTDPGRCPICGTFMEKAALPFRVWK